MGAAVQTPVVIWEPQPGPQTALLRCPVFEVFFGGARGGGKTDGMLGEFASHADLYGEHAIGLMLRQERTRLLETIERSRQIYGPLGARYHEQDKLWRFPNGARLRFAYLERDADADAYQGHSYTRVYVEEIGTFPNPAPIMKLMATLRSGAGVPCAFRATGNPGGSGHQWVKARYIDPCPSGWKRISTEFINPFTGESITRDRVFIPSRLTENKYIGTDYVANLQISGSANLVRAWLEGDWSVIEGAFFDCWNSGKHVIRPFAVPEHWLRFRSGDWGSAKPFSFGWWAIASEDRRENGVVIPKGAMVRYKEWYGIAKNPDGISQPNVGMKMVAEAVGKELAAREKNDKISYGVLDPSAFANDGGPSIAERIYSGSNNKITFRRADNTRITARGAMGGWDQLRSRLVGEDGRPMIYFFSTCVDSIRTIPALQHDPDRPEDVDTDNEDHAGDECRYACMSRPWIAKIPATPDPKFPQHLNINELIKRQRDRRLEQE